MLDVNAYQPGFGKEGITFKDGEKQQELLKDQTNDILIDEQIDQLAEIIINVLLKEKG